MTTHSNKPPRTHLAITLSVWNALFLREVVTRLSSSRGASVWLLVEPILQTLAMLFIFLVIRVKNVSGIEAAAWLIIGLTFIALFKRTSSQVQGGINANRVLFTYRQVKPIDTLLTRAFLEGFLTLGVMLIIAAGAIFLFDVKLIPDDTGLVIGAFLGMWLMGLGYGLILSVAIELIPEIGKVTNLLATPIFLTSGVILPVQAIPEPYRSWMLYNPLLHGIETARLGVSSYYHLLPEIHLAYLYQCATVALFLGLALQIRYTTKILTQ